VRQDVSAELGLVNGFVGARPLGGISLVLRMTLPSLDYLRTGDARPLRPFDRMRLRLRDTSVRRFLTNLDLLDQLALAGEVSFEDLYELAA
jgi:hypothetical protein